MSAPLRFRVVLAGEIVGYEEFSAGRWRFTSHTGPAQRWYLGVFENNEMERWQSAGLTDKNGTEIYEGDIVYRHVHWNECKHRDHTNYDKQKGCNDRGDEYEEVKFENGTFHWFPYWVQADDWEVIGNIHENPNLLGGKYS